MSSVTVRLLHNGLVHNDDDVYCTDDNNDDDADVDNNAAVIMKQWRRARYLYHGIDLLFAE